MGAETCTGSRRIRLDGFSLVKQALIINLLEKMQKNPDGVIETERTFAEFVAEVQGLEECALEAGMRVEEYVKMAALEKMEKDVVSSLSIPQQKESFL